MMVGRGQRNVKSLIIVIGRNAQIVIVSLKYRDPISTFKPNIFTDSITDFRKHDRTEKNHQPFFFFERLIFNLTILVFSKVNLGKKVRS